jgi:hypothetical protein
MRYVLLLMTLLVTLTAYGHQTVTEHTVKLAEGEKPAADSVEVMGWLAGRWTGDGLGGRTEEIWAPPDAGTMIGTFRLIQKDKPVFYEFMSLLNTERGLAMRLKHFHPDGTGWEEKEKFVEFLYVGTVDGVIHFEGLSFQREGADAVTIHLALKGKTGVVREEKFRMVRQK